MSAQLLIAYIMPFFICSSLQYDSQLSEKSFHTHTQTDINFTFLTIPAIHLLLLISAQIIQAIIVP